MKKNILVVILLLLSAVCLIGYAYWINTVVVQNLIKDGDVGLIDEWRPDRILSYVDLESNQIVHQEKLKWQQPIPKYNDSKNRIWFLNPENPKTFSYEVMTNYDLTVHGYNVSHKIESMGTSHGFVIDVNGKLWGWGINADGRTGLGITAGNTTVPTLIDTGDIMFKQVSASNDYTIALDTKGQLWGWGSNIEGRLGQSSLGSRVLTPTLVDTGKIRFTSISASGTNNNTRPHNLAIDTEGKIWSWGDNHLGQTGHGISEGVTWAPKLIPTGKSRFTKVKAAHLHSLAVDTQGRIWGWGSHEHGSTGLGIEAGFATTPQVIVSELITPKVLSTTSRHNIVIDSQGKLWGWGQNLHGKTGLGLASNNTSIPTKIETGTVRFVDVSTSVINTVAIDTEGHLWTWGSNDFGVNGNGTNIGAVLVPTRVLVEGTKFIRVFSNSNGTIAIDTEGRLWGWGSNSTARLGLGVNAGPYLTPVLNPTVIPILTA